jgi:hypothetical protein
MKAERPRRLHGQQIAEQRSVGQVDGERPAQHVAAPCALEPTENLRRTRIFA